MVLQSFRALSSSRSDTPAHVFHACAAITQSQIVFNILLVLTGRVIRAFSTWFKFPSVGLSLPPGSSLGATLLRRPAARYGLLVDLSCAGHEHSIVCCVLPSGDLAIV
jgi:hypothetical protein